MSQVAESYARWLAGYYLLAAVLLTFALVGMALLKQPAQRLAIAKSTLLSVILLAILCAIPDWSVIHLLTKERPQPIAKSDAASSPNVAVEADHGASDGIRF